MKIPIFQISVNDERRDADPEAVQKLADSISKVGLLNPITVDQEYTLIAGLHRLEAAKRLDWVEIECTVSSLEGLLAELAEIDENLVRQGLDYIDEGKQLARRKEIYEALHPETRQGQRNGQTSKTDTVSVLETKPFAEDTAEKIGTTARTIRRKIQVSRNLTPEAQDLAKKEGFRFRDALKLSRLPSEQQAEAAGQLASGDIRSVDEYHPSPTESEGAEKQSTGPSSAQTESPSPPAASPASKEGRCPTIQKLAADLKNPNKDRRVTPDSYLVTFSYFLSRFCQSMGSYTGPEYDGVFPVLTQDHLDQIYQKIQSVHTALDELYHKIEGKVQNEAT